MKKITTILLILSLLLFSFCSIYFWGYFTHSRKIFPYKIISNEYKVLQKSNKKKELNFSILKRTKPYDLIKVNETNYDSLKTFLNEKVFGRKDLSNKLPDTVYNITNENYNSEIINNIQVLNINLDSEFNSVVYRFQPNTPNNKVLIYHQGHSGGFILGKKTIEHFVKKGFVVYALTMPLIGLNTKKRTLNSVNLPYRKNIVFKETGGLHTQMKFLNNPISYFIEPVIRTLNYISETDKLTDISMVGISGGGWTTCMTTAIDNRITRAFDVAGSYPIYIRMLTDNSWGDFEQNYPPIFKHIDYLDLYVMGCSNQRKYFQILNKYDPCCFQNALGIYYQSDVSRKIKELNFGDYNLFMDTLNKEHSIGNMSLDYIEKQISID